MPTLTIEYQTDAERLILEQALAFSLRCDTSVPPPRWYGTGRL
ncbi:hypothetical protein [Gemmata palustris]|nr:hypothetical protein [Gemmata palustris]